jgi:hypothetical protein
MPSKKCRHATCSGDICRRIKKPKKLYKLKRKYICKISKKQVLKIKDKKELSEKDKLFYQEIWNEREHICFETGIYLGDESKTLFFHHVLEKGTRAYKAYRHCKWNIVLISWQVHDQVGMDIDKCPKIKAYRDLIIKKYITNETI